MPAIPAPRFLWLLLLAAALPAAVMAAQGGSAPVEQASQPQAAVEGQEDVVDDDPPPIATEDDADDPVRLPSGVSPDEPHPRIDGPQMTWGQVIQLYDGTTDRTRRLDEPGWYPLFANAAGWDGPIQPGARIPDYSRIRDDPERYRGHLFLIEGYFIRADPFDAFHRVGDHLENVQEWVIRLHDDPRHRDTVIVYLVDPPEQPPPDMEPVRLSARFYKILESVDENVEGRPRAYYPVFVGHSVDVGDDRGAGGVGTMSTGNLATAIMVLLLAAAALIFFARRALRMSLTPAPLPSRTLGEGRGERQDDTTADASEDAGPPLPEDPVEALREMERRRETDSS